MICHDTIGYYVILHDMIGCYMIGYLGILEDNAECYAILYVIQDMEGFY